MSYDAVLGILRGPSVPQPWPDDVAPAPSATETALQTMSPRDVAGRIEEFLWSAAGSINPPHPLKTQDECYVYLRYQYFSIGKEYWEYNTAIALGQIIEPPVDKVAEAKSVSEWLANQANGRTRQGYVLYETDNPASMADRVRREARAAAPPYEWSMLGKQLHWQLAVLEGYYATPVDALSAAYSVKVPSLDSIRNLDAQQWLDNLRCDDNHHKPRKWLDDGTLNPKFAGF